MLNKLSHALRKYNMLQPGDTVICAVSGGADSMALLFGMYLLAPKFQVQLQAAHFNHQLRAEESDADEYFVREFCESYGILLHTGTQKVKPGKKGLEAAARDARYAFLRALPGKILTAHTANDNAETVLMHLIRGTGLKGLTGIRPVSGTLLRPMLEITREDVLVFLQEYNIRYIEDSSNSSDAFLRNRLRKEVMPLLARENPRLAENVSQMALRLTQEEDVLQELALSDGIPTDVKQLQAMPAYRRRRVLAAFLQNAGVAEPSSANIAQAEALVFSQKPSAYAVFPGNVTITRCYDALQIRGEESQIPEQELTCPGCVTIPHLNLQILCERAQQENLKTDCFTVVPVGKMIVRNRREGDALRLQGGMKSVKKLFIDKKIPAAERMQIPVISDDAGVLGIYSVGANLDRAGSGQNAVCITFQVL